MKIATLVFSLLLLPFFDLRSQDIWPDAEAEWYLHIEACFTPNVLTHYEVTGTEVITGEECTVLHRTTYSSWGDSYESDHYVYFNGDTLFWYYNEAFFPLLCFNLEEGDVWYPLPEDTLQTGPGCDYSGMVIDNKTMVEYNGQSYREISISSEVPVPDDWEEPWPSIFWQGTFNERTFVQTEQYSSSWFFPEYNICDAIVEWDCPTFACYSDSELSIQPTEEACDYPLWVSLDENEFDNTLLFPNPVKSGDDIHINSTIQIGSIQVFDLTGKLLIERSNPGLTMTLDLPPGQYLTRIKVFNGSEVVSKMVVMP